MHGTTTLLTGLLAASAVVASPAARKHKRNVSGAGNQVVAYWGNTGYNVQGDAGNIPIEDICSNDDVDKVIISFLTEFPDQRPINSDKLPVLNLANSCGLTFKDRDGPNGSNLLWCPMLEAGLRICQQKGKELLLSLGGATPGKNGFASQESAESLATWIYQHFGPKVASVTERPFGDIVLDGIDLDIESLDPNHGQNWYPEFARKLKALSNNNWAIGAAPQCVVEDANLGTYIQQDFIDYIFVQLYNTGECSARKQLDERSASTNTWESKWLTGNYAPRGSYANNQIQVFAGLPASKIASNNLESGYGYYLAPDEVRRFLANTFQSSSAFRFGGVSLWDATYDFKNDVCGHPYSHWVKKAINQALIGDTTPILPNGACPIVSSSSSSSIASSTSSVASSTSSVASSTSSAFSSSSVESSSSSAVASSSSSIASSTSSAASSSSSDVYSSSSASSSASVSSAASSSASSAASVSSVASSSASVSSAPSSSVPASSSPSSSKASTSAPAITSSTSSYIHIASSSSFASHGPYTNSSTSASHHGGSGPHPTSSYIGGGGHNGGGYGGASSSVGGGYNGGHNGGSRPSSSPAGGYGNGPSKSYGGGYVASTTSSKAYGGGYGHPTATKTSTTTYVDVCPTGLTTVTATYTRTCYEGDDESDYTGVPPGWTVTVTEYVPHYGAKPTPVTVTKPAEVPAKPTYVPKPDGGAKPVSTLVVVVTPVPAAEYGAYVAKQSAAAAAAAAASQGSYAKPAYGNGAESSAVAKPVTGYSPSKPAGGSWPQGTYAPSGTKGVYAPQFTGAASRMNVGFGLFAGAAVAAIAAF